LSRGKDRRSFGKDLTNTSIVMRTKWRKVVSLMIHSHSNKRKRVIGQAMKRTLTINIIIPASKPLTQLVAAKRHLPVSNSNAPKSR